jgi:hypothetical protein
LQRQFRHFEDGLRGILAGHFDVTHEIDTILESSPPGAETLKRLMPLLGGAQQLHHFFERIEHTADPAWLEPLEQSKFLAPPKPIRDESRGTAYWGWPAGRYLKRVATVPEAQEAVVRIAAEIETDNVRVHDDIGDIALALPPRLAAKLVPRLVKWLAKSYVDWSQLDDKLGALAARLAEGGERAGALELLRKLTGKPVRNHRGEPTSLEPYGLRGILRRDLPAIIGGLGLEGFTVVCKALDAELRSFGEDAEQDRSEVWRPAVERDGQSPGSMRDVLVEAVVRAGELCVANGTGTLPEIVERLEAHGPWIFRRIALHVIRALPTPPPDLVAPRLLDRTLFDRFITCREYRMLLQ